MHPPPIKSHLLAQKFEGKGSNKLPQNRGRMFSLFKSKTFSKNQMFEFLLTCKALKSITKDGKHVLPKLSYILI